jgi:5-methylcytosine-specific restriction endonuclease McrA
MSNFVFILNSNKRPLNPVHPGQARRLLKAGKAAVYRRYPFTIILKSDISSPAPPSCQIKIDPGAKTTGIAILQGDKVVWGAELTHRGFAIRDALYSRRILRRGRRNRKTRYRQPRFLNRTRREGWLPPSLVSRVENIRTWVKRLIKFCPVASIAQELVRFDAQLMQDPSLQGSGYQQGTLHQYEVREYVLEKWGRKCAYCGVENVPLEVEHIQPRSRGGSNRPSNLTLACVPCNQGKGNQDIRDFLIHSPSLLERILSVAKHPLVDAAAVNSTRWALFNALLGLGLPVTTGTGGQTKYNRTTQGVSKTHWHDAAMVGTTPQLRFLTKKPLLIIAKGHGVRQRAVTDKYGFPKQHRGRIKLSHGFKTGDIVDADIPKGKYAGRYKGLRIAIRTLPTFAVYPKNGGKQFDAHCKYLTVVHKADGYAFSFAGGNSSNA